METYKQTDMTSARLFVESEKLAQAVDEFAKQLQICRKACMERHNEHSQ